MNDNWLDRLALSLANRSETDGRQQARRLSRAEVIRRGAFGALALTGLGALEAHPASARTSANCFGGSLKNCNAAAKKYVNKILGYCDEIDPMDIVESVKCLQQVAAEQTASKKFCSDSCPKPKKPKKPGSAGGTGGTSKSGSGGHTPTCGALDCYGTDKCCPSSAGPICCAICCNTNGNGCGSSSSDCGA